MTYCEECHCHLGSNRSITKHLEDKHGIHVRLGEDSNLAYCDDCHKYLGKQRHFVDCRKALEKHVETKHKIRLHEGCME